VLAELALDRRDEAFYDRVVVALIVSIETPTADSDIRTPVANEVGVAVKSVEIE
jgi:hypothetical protein